MPTINKIPMMGYSPIANRKSNQKASNPISANNQDSRDLMSPNAHYGRHAVSFKARITPEAATEFLTNFNFNVAADQLITNNIKNDLKSKTKTLLSIMNLSIKKYPTLKPGALDRLSYLLNHDNTAVRGFTLDNISDSKAIKSVISDLIHPVARCLRMQEHENVRYSALSAVPKLAKVDPDVVVTSGLINGPIRRIIHEDSSEFNRAQAFRILGECVKFKPDIVHHLLDSDIIERGLTDPHQYVRSATLGTVKECVKVNRGVVQYLLDRSIIQRGCADPDPFVRKFTLNTVAECVKVNHQIVQPLLTSIINGARIDEDPLVRAGAFNIASEYVKVKPDIVPHLLGSDIIERGLADSHSNVPKEALNTVSECVKVKPDIMPEAVRRYIVPALENTDDKVRKHSLEVLVSFMDNKPEIVPGFIRDYISPRVQVENERSSFVRRFVLNILNHLGPNNPKILTPELLNSIKLLTSSKHKAERNLAIPVYNNLASILENWEKSQQYALISAMGVRNDIPHTDENIKNHIFSFVKRRPDRFTPAPPPNVQ